MVWNSDMGRYEGETSDGNRITVDGDAFAEARQDRIKEGQSWEEADAEVSQVSNWDADMHGVEVQ